MGKFILILVLILIYSPPIYACSCIELPFEESVDRADEIFIGRVIKIEEKKELLSTEFGEYWVAHFEVSKKWKGNKKTNIRVIQTYNSCAFFFEFGKEYLVYATSTNRFAWDGTRNFSTWLCSRTIYTRYFYDLAKADKEGWTWDDREALNNEFPDQVKISSFYNNLPIWLAMLFVVIGYTLIKVWSKN